MKGESEIELHVRNNSDSEMRKDDLNIVSMFVVNTRSSLYRFICNRKKLFFILALIVVNVLAVSYFTAAVMIYLRKDKPSPFDKKFWDGIGLLIVLYAFFYGGLFYYYVVKRCVGRRFNDHIVKPLKNVVHTLMANKFFRWICYLTPFVALVIYLILDTAGNRYRLISFSGIVVFTIFGFIFSASPGSIRWRPVFTGLALQFIFGLMTIKWELGKNVLSYTGDKTAEFLKFTQNGTSFVYGPLVQGEFPDKFGSIFAFSVIPVIFFFSFCVSILSYYGALQWFILKIAWVVQIIMGTTVLESVNAAASIFLGMTESILLFKNNIEDLTKSELHAIMCEGLATVSGTVLAAYISFGVSPNHLIAASVMSAPAALSFSKLFYPETEESRSDLKNIVLVREEASNVLDAACNGASTGISIIASIIANIVAFLAFVAFLDSSLHWLGLLVDFEDLSFQYILKKVFIPISFLMGVDFESLEDVSLLVGTKTVVNEFQAYLLLTKIKDRLSPRSEAIATYALCGFSNFASIGVLIGMLSALAPGQRSSATEVAWRSFIASNIVCFITACVAGTLMDV